ncbi:MAG: Type II/IV secretion system protein TadC, associated with Flp pilus assembly [Candidatus Ozemobacter sibiricus]|uniref:Type II/IV secretion system protein TadC, associated with Flp pilus assembly n=1 Tax=Candidatus Ozemobacter sibiricus TaxID=2268124 RepID=A0A367ZUA4_9BACT|nr:MAG: Type II/IV secretion system protein TadC, associated with Flp pilus assembly [Candidatus Ozemobacter sibiricus]
MSRWFLVLVATPLILALAAGAQAGQGFSSSLEGISALDFPKISLTVRVFTPEPVTLTADDFLLQERQTPITSFSVELTRQEPFVALLLDRSSSMEPVIGQVREAAAAFTQAIAGRARLALLTFASDIDLVQDFTRDPAPVLAGIKAMRPWGGTALYDGIFRAAEQLRNGAGRDDQKVLVVLTDGKDESPQGKPGFSIKKPQELFEHVRRTGVRVIAVGLGTNLDLPFLTALASESRGTFLKAPTADQLAGTFQAITRRLLLERRYRLVYQTPDPRRDGTRRDLQIISRCKGQQDQGTGFYLAPGPDQATGPATARPPATGGSGGTLRHDLSLGRLTSPDLGSATPIGHLGHASLGTYTPIATLTADHPAAQPGIEAANRAIAETNRTNQELFRRNQAAFDRQMDAVNQVIDRTNASTQAAQEAAQQAADEGTAAANEALEEAEQAGKIDLPAGLDDDGAGDSDDEDD